MNVDSLGALIHSVVYLLCSLLTRLLNRSPQTNYLCSKCFALSRKRKDTDELGSSSSKTQQEETTIKPVTKQAKLEPPCELKTDVAPTSNAVAPLSSPTTDLIKCGTCKKVCQFLIQNGHLYKFSNFILHMTFFLIFILSSRNSV